MKENENCRCPAHLRDLTKDEAAEQDFWYTSNNDKHLRHVGGLPVIRLDPVHIERQLQHLNRREAQAKDVADREAVKRRRASLIVDLGLKERTQAQRAAAADDYGFEITALPRLTDDDGEAFIALDFADLRGKIDAHLAERKKAKDADDEEEAVCAWECLTGLSCIIASSHVGVNIGKFMKRAGVIPPAKKFQ